jgi:prevent-host-death family protein
MIVINIHEAKAKLSEYLDAVAKGERVLICKRNQPVAELRAVEQKRTEPRTIGGGPYHFDVPASFFEPMPDEFLDAFESGSVYPESQSPPSRVADVPAGYAAGPARGDRTAKTAKGSKLRTTKRGM